MQDVLLDAMQWPAMAVTVYAAWLVASSREERRAQGFWWFLASNVLWVIWGVHTAAWALVVLQVCLAAMNIRGAAKNDVNAETPAKDESPQRSTSRPSV
jgi:hypothetical protein